MDIKKTKKKEEFLNIKIGFFKTGILLEEIEKKSTKIKKIDKKEIHNNQWLYMGTKESTHLDKQRSNFIKILKSDISPNHSQLADEIEDNIKYENNKTSIAIVKKNNINGNDIFSFICSGEFELFFYEKYLERLSGLRILLNQNKEVTNNDSIKGYKSRNLANGVRKSIENMKTIKSLDALQHNSDTELITLIKFITEFSGIKQTISASNILPIKVPSSFKFNDIFKLIEESISSNKYKDNSLWKTISKIEPMNNEKLVEKLDNILIEEINKKKEIGDFISFDWPSEIDANIDKFVVYTKAKGSKEYEYLDNDILIDLLSLESDVREIFKMKINSIDEFDNQNENSYEIYECIFFETFFEKEKYVLCYGNWYKINNDFFDMVEDKYKKIPLYNLKGPGLVIPDWEIDKEKGLDSKGKNKYFDEKRYIEKIREKNNNHEIFIIDQRFLQESNNKIEIGDLLFRTDNSIFAIKKYAKSSSSISHLISQVNHSLKALENPEEINVQMQNKNILYDFKKVEKIVLMIASSKKTESGLPNLPFFARADLSNVNWNSTKIKQEICHIQLQKNKDI